MTIELPCEDKTEENLFSTKGFLPASEGFQVLLIKIQ